MRRPVMTYEEYLAHFGLKDVRKFGIGAAKKAHKYIDKINDRYFYTKEELNAYLHGKKKQHDDKKAKQWQSDMKNLNAGMKVVKSRLNEGAKEFEDKERDLNASAKSWSNKSAKAQNDFMNGNTTDMDRSMREMNNYEMNASSRRQQASAAAASNRLVTDVRDYKESEWEDRAEEAAKALSAAYPDISVLDMDPKAREKFKKNYIKSLKATKKNYRKIAKHDPEVKKYMKHDELNEMESGLLFDSTGMPLAHANIGGTAHKYLQKIGNRYFYTRDELNAYLGKGARATMQKQANSYHPTTKGQDLKAQASASAAKANSAIQSRNTHSGIALNQAKSGSLKAAQYHSNSADKANMNSIKARQQQYHAQAEYEKSADNKKAMLKDSAKSAWQDSRLKRESDIFKGALNERQNELANKLSSIGNAQKDKEAAESRARQQQMSRNLSAKQAGNADIEARKKAYAEKNTPERDEERQRADIVGKELARQGKVRDAKSYSDMHMKVYDDKVRRKKAQQTAMKKSGTRSGRGGYAR